MHEVYGGLVIGHAELVTSYTDPQYIAILSTAMQFINSRHSAYLPCFQFWMMNSDQKAISLFLNFFYNH